MKKTIKILSVIVIAVFVITPILSNLRAFVSIKTYDGWMEADESFRLKTVIFSNIPILYNAVFNVLACIYLIKHLCKGERYTAEIVLLSVRIVVLPLIGTGFSYFLASYNSVQFLQYYSIYSNLNSSFSLLQSIAGTLLIIALAFSISEKVHNKKQSATETADTDF